MSQNIEVQRLTEQLRDAARLREAAEAAAEHERAQRVAADAARVAADAARVAAEGQAEHERAQRVAADAARVAAEAAAERERALRVAAEADSLKQRAATFFATLRGMSGSASEHAAVSADVSRRGAPAPELLNLEAFFDGMPAVDDADVQAAWDVCRPQLAARPAVPASDLGKLSERKFVHPLLWLLLEAALQPEDKRVLRLWREAAVEDSVPHAHAQPDVLFTHIRDMLPSSLGACFSMEFKRWVTTLLEVACAQAANYGRRLTARQVMELLDRGAALSDVCVLTAASNGLDVVFIRVRSGVRAGEEDPFGGTPCPTEQSPPLPLLREWNPAHPTRVPTTPPAGFAALVRVLRMPPALLNACTLPLERITVSAPPLMSGELQLGVRLGCGGSSDAYACTLPNGDAAVIKVARAATRRTNAMFDTEARSLQALGAAAHGAVPQLLGAGSRELLARAQVLPSDGCVLPWQLLVLAPVGAPLGSALVTHLAHHPAAPDDARAARRAFGDVVIHGVLRGLQAAHAAGIIHCDVRPSNVVFLAKPRPAGAALLVDYGLSRAVGKCAAGVGVRVYAADCVFSQSTCAARAGLDLVAAAYTWLSVAYGDAACRAPWRVANEAASAWLARESVLDAHVARIAAALDELVRPRGNTPAEARWYQWPWPDAPHQTSAE